MPTQEEIARAVGVSRMTVYRYLKGKNVTKNTRQKIERFLQRVEYRPNLTARSLVMRQTRLIGLLVPSVSYSYYPEVIGALQKEIRDRGYNLLLCVSEEDPVQEKTELNLLLSIPVDGIIISPTSFPESEQNCRMLEDEKPPFVMFDRYFPSVRASYVTTDSYRASEALVQHLIDLGHRRIAHVGGPPSNFFANGILRGYKSALRKNGLPLEERSIFTVSMDGSDCLPALRAILGLKPRPSAIQAVNDPVAVELFKEASLLFIDANVPKDTLRTVMSLARKAHLPVCVDPTSVVLAPRLRPYLSRFFLITPNMAEATVLCDRTTPVVGLRQALDAAKCLVTNGVEIAIVTLAEQGLCYATSETYGHIPAIKTTIVDPTGAGDALSAAVIFALLNDIPLDDAVRLGVSAASLTLHSRGAVASDLSLEKLYDQLVI